MSNPKKIRIGSRGSPLALRQVEMVKAALGSDVETETVIIKTSGDWNPEGGEVALPESGRGKALFAKEIEEALLEGKIDCAVHSMKDMDSTLPEGLIIPCMLPREDARDALISRDGSGLDDLPEGAIVGTTSPRRKAFLLARRPDLKIVPFRGNVGTRLEKLKAGQVDATLLAVAGLKRLGLEDRITEILEPEDMIPSAGQGAIGVELLAKNKQLMSKFSQINCSKTISCVSSERSFIGQIGGSCHTPVGAHAVWSDGVLSLSVKLSRLDGSQFWTDTIHQKISLSEEGIGQAIEAGKTLGKKFKSMLPEGVI